MKETRNRRKPFVPQPVLVALLPWLAVSVYTPFASADDASEAYGAATAAAVAVLCIGLVVPFVLYICTARSRLIASVVMILIGAFGALMSLGQLQAQKQEAPKPESRAAKTTHRP